MNDKEGLKFIWISQFGSLVEIRIKEISKRLIHKGITPIILTHKLQKSEKVNFNKDKKGMIYYHFRNPLFFNYNSKLFKLLRETFLKLAFIFGGMPLLYSDIKTLVKDNSDIKFIYATGPLFFTHILGYLLKKKLQTKLVVEYTDPWYNNPYSKEGKIKIFDKFIDYHIERRILQTADIIVSNSKYLNKILQKNYPFIIKKPIFAVEDGLNLQTFNTIPKKEENRIIITFGGKIYGKRNIYPLFKILSDLKKEQFFKDLNLLVKIYGKYPKKVFESELNRLDIADLFYLGDFIPRSELLKEIMESDIALHIGEFLDYPTIAFKVWEYLSCRKKILFLNIEDSYRSNFIRKHNLGVVLPLDNLKKGKEILKKLLHDIKNQNFNSLVDENTVMKFTWDNRANKFLQTVIKSISN